MAESQAASAAGVTYGHYYVGPYVGWDWSEADGERAPLGDLRVGLRRWDGEPGWQRFWFRPDAKELLDSCRSIGAGEIVVVAYEARRNRTTGRTSFMARAMEPLSSWVARALPVSQKAAS